MKEKIVTRDENNCVLFFIKYPEEGKVKSRLSVEVDEATVVHLYRNFVVDLLQMLQTTIFTIIICYYPNDKIEKFKQWLGQNYYLPQHGENLGERMKNCFKEIFSRGYKNAVIIGSDSPDLPCSFIEMAFDSLKEHDVVIGPCFDGGYYLLGLTQHSFSSKIFDGIKWGTETVFQETIEKLKHMGFKIHLLPIWRDVDTLRDLLELFRKNQDNKFSSSKTMAFLSKFVKGL